MAVSNPNNLTIYCPTGIQERARGLHLKVSEVCRRALLAEIERVEKEQISGVISKPTFHRGNDTPEESNIVRG
jgi:hypothetical protein